MTAPGPILVTGASGFLGAHVAARLTREGNQVLGLSRRGPDGVDLRDPAAVRKIFDHFRFREVYHFAAYGVRNDQTDPSELVGVSTLAAVNLARAALDFGVERFLYMGTAFEYAPCDMPVGESARIEPVNLYGAAKAAASLLLNFFYRTEALPLITLRAFAVYGPGELPPKLIPFVCSEALKDQPIRLTAGTQVRDYLYVDDLVDGVMAAREHAAPGSVYNLGGGPENAMPLRSVVEAVVEAAGRPLSLCRFGAVVPKRQEPATLIADISRAKADLGWSPRTSLAEGIARTVEWNMSTAQ